VAAPRDAGLTVFADDGDGMRVKKLAPGRDKRYKGIIFDKIYEAYPGKDGFLSQEKVDAFYVEYTEIWVDI
jgi:hypothetical protein